MSKSIRYLIVDDEILSQRNLSQAITEQSSWQLIGTASSVSQAREILTQALPDVIFLDIQMPRESGLSLAREWMGKETPPLIIFVTAFDEHAIEAFRLHALDYLLKPINDVHLRQAIDRAEEMLHFQQQAHLAQSLREMFQDEHKAGEPTTELSKTFWDHISIRSIGRIDRVAVKDIVWVEAQGNYVLLHLHEGRMMYRASMSQLEQHLDPHVFIRTHRSVLVRTHEISSLQVLADHSYEAVLKNQVRLPISERHLAKVKQALNQPR